MSKTQKRFVSPPSEEFKDFSEVIQGNLEDLFELAHNHSIRTSIPESNEGEVGDILGVRIEDTYYLYFKFSSGWKRVTLT